MCVCLCAKKEKRGREKGHRRRESKRESKERDGVKNLHHYQDGGLNMDHKGAKTGVIPASAVSDCIRICTSHRYVCFFLVS